MHYPGQISQFNHNPKWHMESKTHSKDSFWLTHKKENAGSAYIYIYTKEEEVIKY